MAKKHITEMTGFELREELAQYRSIDFTALLMYIGNGIVWMVMNWSKVRAEIEKLKKILGK